MESEPFTADRNLPIDIVIGRGGPRDAPHREYREKSILLDVTHVDPQAQVYLRLWVYVGDVQQDGLFSVLPMRSVPRTSSPDDDVYRQVPVCSERFALHLEWNSFRAASRTGDRGEKWLVLVHLRPALGHLRACRVSTSTAPQQGHLIATCSSILTKRLHMPTNSAAGMTRREVCWPRSKARSSSCPL